MADQQENYQKESDTASPDISPDESAEVVSVKRHPLGWFFDFVEILVFAVCAALLVFAFGFRLCQVSGDSMYDTLKHEEMLVVSSLSKPKAGDIVVFHMTGDAYNEPLVKRVIATEGQTVRIDYNEQTVSVDDRVIDEPYISLLGNGSNGSYVGIDYMYPYGNHHMVENHTVFEAVVPAGCYFVMGDNRNHSADSRSSAIGFVDGRRMLGTVVCRVSPFTSADELK